MNEPAEMKDGQNVETFRETAFNEIIVPGENGEAEGALEQGRGWWEIRETFPVSQGNHRLGWRDYVNSKGRQHRLVEARIQVYQKFGERAEARPLAIKVLEFLAREQTPPEVVEAVLEQAEAGNVLNISEVKNLLGSEDAREERRDERDDEIVDRADNIVNFEPEPNQPDLPTKTEAKDRARESGGLVLARDGRYYSGRSDEEVAQENRATEIIFDIKDGVEMIANVGCSAQEYLGKLPSYMRWNKAEIAQAREALDWLGEFVSLIEEQ